MDMTLNLLLSVLIIALIVLLAREYKKIEKLNHLIKKMEELVDHLRNLSITDELTDVFNRRGIINQVEQEMGRSKRYGRKFSLVLIDIDEFKKINDLHGHHIGDTVLIVLTTLIIEEIRQADKIGRLGGDEIVVLLPESDLSNSFEIAERIREKVEKDDNSAIKFTISVGVAEYDPAVDLNVDEFIKNADRAMYNAKKGGRNKVEKW